MLVWPSAMATPDPSTYGYARIHQFDIIAVGYPGDFVGRDGLQLQSAQDSELPMLKLATVDLDRTFVHWDYNAAKVKQLLHDYPQIVVEQPGPPFYLLRSTDNHTSVRALCAARGIETNRQYIHRSRRGLNSMRQQQQQQAAAGSDSLL